MEVDFDKEIDALLRKARGDGPVLIGDFAGSRHLDADEISAFAENAMPERSRALYTVHLADCDRCRTILSNLLALNSEAASAAASSPVSAITIAERDMPWYSKLFAFPNLAYVMGGLILIFGGFLAFTIVRNTGMGDAVVSRVAESDSQRGGPNFQEDGISGATNSANMSANAAANTAAGDALLTNTNSLAETDATPGERGPLASSAEPRADRQGIVVDGVDSASSVSGRILPPPPPAAMAAPTDVRTEDRDQGAKEKTEAKVAQSLPHDQSKGETALKQQQYPSSGATQSGPMRNSENQYNRQLENLDRRRAAAKRSDTDEEGSSGRRSVGGRTFERKQGVWYDMAYAGRPTINVRRGSAEFSRLDGGLRSIANSLSGTIVVVWGAKAYRIQ